MGEQAQVGQNRERSCDLDYPGPKQEYPARTWGCREVSYQPRYFFNFGATAAAASTVSIGGASVQRQRQRSDRPPIEL
jgi:hypothetical protein